jgi:hypothetical protein
MDGRRWLRGLAPWMSGDGVRFQYPDLLAVRLSMSTPMMAVSLRPLIGKMN